MCSPRTRQHRPKRQCTGMGCDVCFRAQQIAVMRVRVCAGVQMAGPTSSLPSPSPRHARRRAQEDAALPRPTASAPCGHGNAAPVKPKQLIRFCKCYRNAATSLNGQGTVVDSGRHRSGLGAAPCVCSWADRERGVSAPSQAHARARPELPAEGGHSTSTSDSTQVIRSARAWLSTVLPRSVANPRRRRHSHGHSRFSCETQRQEIASCCSVRGPQPFAGARRLTIMDADADSVCQ